MNNNLKIPTATNCFCSRIKTNIKVRREHRRKNWFKWLKMKMIKILPKIELLKKGSSWTPSRKQSAATALQSQVAYLDHLLGEVDYLKDLLGEVDFFVDDGVDDFEYNQAVLLKH